MTTQVFHLEIPSDRVDLIDMAKFISQKIASLTQVNSVKKTNEADKGLEKIMSFAGSQSGAFKDMSIEDMRKTRLLDRESIFRYEYRYIVFGLAKSRS